MTLNKIIKFLIAIALQLALIFGIIIFKYSILSGGTAVFLKIQPVDPRDPLRGDYVTFQYDVSRVDRHFFNYSPANGDTVYVPLRKSGKYWQAYYGINKTKPKDNKLYLKAKVKSGGVSTKSKNYFDFDSQNEKITLEYGIEEFFIPENSGQGVSFWNKEAYAKVKIDDMGNAVLEQIYVNDKPWP